MLPPRPFSATSKKKTRKTPVMGTVQRPQYVGNTPGLLLLLAAHSDLLLVPNCLIWGAGGSRVEQGEVSCMAVGMEWHREGWPLPGGPLRSVVTVDSDKIVQTVPVYEGILPHS